VTFDDILAQVITLLKRQGRVSYRALKMRFNLDDEYLDVLKEELLYVHPVRDDEGRGLVWTGNVEGTTATPAPPPQSIPAPLTQPTEHLTGAVERVTFHSEESGFCVLRVKVRGHKDLVTVVGTAATITPGEYIEGTGWWVNDRTHGLQFKTQHLRVVPPSTLEGIEKYHIPPDLVVDRRASDGEGSSLLDFPFLHAVWSYHPSQNNLININRLKIYH
jgi:hypothetical protein